MTDFLQQGLDRNGVLTIKLDRPPVNAFNEEFWRGLQQVIESASENAAVRCVVLASVLPKVFTAGLDLKEASALSGTTESDPARKALKLRRHLLEFQNAISSLEKCQKPVIAALHGLNLGLAVDIACACDIRLCSEDAIFGIKEVDIGLAADIGTLQRLPKITGNDSLVRELVLTGRNFDANEAMSIGFVSRVIKGGQKEVLAAAHAMARVIASKSPVAIMGSKELLNFSRDHSVQEGLDYTAVWNSFALQTEDLPRAMSAVLAKSTADFAPISKL